MGNFLSVDPGNVDSWASTEIEVENFSFLWTIKKFSAFQATKELCSPHFIGGSKSSHKWQLKIYPRYRFEDKEYLSTYLTLVSHGDSEKDFPEPYKKNRKLKVRVRYQISFIDSKGFILKKVGGPQMIGQEFDAKNCSWGYTKIIPTTELLSPLRGLLDGDCLRIHCCIWVDGDLRHKTGLGGVANYKSAEVVGLRHLNNLSRDMKLAFNNSEFVDVTLIASDKRFLAHKAVLSARSRVFKAMFSCNMVESAVNIVRISDFEEETVKSMLEFIYSGRTSVSRKNASDLLRIAEKYELADLKEDCEQVIGANLTCENAAEVLVLAHFHNASNLKATTVEFIKMNKEKLRPLDAFTQVAQAHGGLFVDLCMSQ